MFDLKMSWATYFRGGSVPKLVLPSSWGPPSIGVLKLNFVGSFLKDARKGGLWID